MAKGGDVIVMSDKDLKGGGGFKALKPGKKQVHIDKESSIKKGKKGNLLNLVLKVTKSPIGKEEKGKKIFDNIAPHVGWKIAQVLKAIGMKDKEIKALLKKKATLKDILAILKKYKEDIRVLVTNGMWEGSKTNKVKQYLPLAAGADEEDDDIDEDDEDEDDEDEDNDEDSDDDSDDDDDDDSDDDDDDSDDDDDDTDEDDDDDDDDDSDDDDDEDEDEDDDEDEDEDEDEDDEDEDEDEDDDDDEEDEKPKRRGRKPATKRGGKKPAAKRGKAKGGKRGKKK